MCNQAVGLIAGALERRGIATVCIRLLREIAERVRPPRSLVVPFEHGFPLGAPNDVQLQRTVMVDALSLLGHAGPGPVIIDFEPRRGAKAPSTR